ncbi:2-dehydro-3-deoxygalactonokinase [Aurantimonas sp. MSK8Z-1]|uniref:2-dehydro-3-deoxygalactonokinase n=1 Tax=Mangrovibrevibacter kandeliae TaxID=2968473 RepID=UPI0021188782|nr:2-dehydro-3-deoxygalactonokinase [Aurantimonas sp. MSK8Z-1]MCW4116106.1 2-dehydro-3-deoxygalactonokinase [Aurantimonas sp. MSK8Z-1]
MTTTEASLDLGFGGEPFVAAVDWGTSSFRLWLIDRAGRVLSGRRSGQGMLEAAETGFSAVLEAHLHALGAPLHLPVVICGMAGARQGWVEAPYADTPADLAAIAGAAVPVPQAGRDVRILPGVAQRDRLRPDVMRGEETQLLGLTLLGHANGLVCLPGTHSKWVRLDGGCIVEFATFMTGELYAVLAKHSILRHSLAADGSAPERREAFAGGIADALDAPALTTNRLFALRAGGLLHDRDPQDAAARLSGLLIGLELAGVRQFGDAAGEVILAVSGPLQAVYGEALAIAGFAARTVDAEDAVHRGLYAAARYTFLEEMTA